MLGILGTTLLTQLHCHLKEKCPTKLWKAGLAVNLQAPLSFSALELLLTHKEHYHCHHQQRQLRLTVCQPLCKVLYVILFHSHNRPIRQVFLKLWMRKLRLREVLIMLQVYTLGEGPKCQLGSVYPPHSSLPHTIPEVSL